MLKQCLRFFKRKTESDVSFREFSKALERHGFTKSKSDGLIVIRKIKFKPANAEADFVD